MAGRPPVTAVPSTAAPAATRATRRTAASRARSTASRAPRSAAAPAPRASAESAAFSDGNGHTAIEERRHGGPFGSRSLASCSIALATGCSGGTAADAARRRSRQGASNDSESNSGDAGNVFVSTGTGPDRYTNLECNQAQCDASRARRRPSAGRSTTLPERSRSTTSSSTFRTRRSTRSLRRAPRAISAVERSRDRRSSQGSRTPKASSSSRTCRRATTCRWSCNSVNGAGR